MEKEKVPFKVFQCPSPMAGAWILFFTINFLLLAGAFTRHAATTKEEHVFLLYIYFGFMPLHTYYIYSLWLSLFTPTDNENWMCHLIILGPVSNNVILWPLLDVLVVILLILVGIYKGIRRCLFETKEKSFEEKEMQKMKICAEGV